ncbi:MAG: hypothetical protein GX483_01950 [Actinomycetaceae bacterium]|nr:hypothetical protein [Actinomycetaceae bacterium]
MIAKKFLSLLTATVTLASLSACGLTGTESGVGGVSPDVAEVLDGKSPEEYTVDDVVTAAPQAMQALDSWAVTYTTEKYTLGSTRESASTITYEQSVQRDPWITYAALTEVSIDLEPFEVALYLYEDANVVYYAMDYLGEWAKTIPAEDPALTEQMVAAMPNPDRVFPIPRIHELDELEINVVGEEVVLTGNLETMGGNIVNGVWEAVYRFNARTLVIQSIEWTHTPANDDRSDTVITYIYSNFNEVELEVPTDVKDAEVTGSFLYSFAADM